MKESCHKKGASESNRSTELDVKHLLLQYCNTLQHTATHCNTLQHTAIHAKRAAELRESTELAVKTLMIATLQHTATHCSTL